MTEFYLVCCMILLGVMISSSYLLFRQLIRISKENNELRRQLRKRALDEWQRKPHTVDDMFLN